MNMVKKLDLVFVVFIINLFFMFGIKKLKIEDIKKIYVSRFNNIKW